MAEQQPRLNLAWNGAFADQIMLEPAFAVEMVQYTVEGSRAARLEQYSTGFAGDDTGERYAVVMSGTPLADFNPQIENGERVVVGCAPLETASWEQWNIGVAAAGDQLGSYQMPEWLEFPAVALPLTTAGLRVWIGRLRRPGPPESFPIIDRTLSKGLTIDGPQDAPKGHPPLEGVPRAQLPRLYPNVVIVEPPEPLR